MSDDDETYTLVRQWKLDRLATAVTSATRASERGLRRTEVFRRWQRVVAITAECYAYDASVAQVTAAVTAGRERAVSRAE